MQFGLYLPTFGDFADVRLLAALAHEADRTGWHGLFIWDELLGMGAWHAGADTTVALTTIAASTQRLRFGALVTPLARRRPAKFARETATLDRLSGGRLIVGAGIGNPSDQFDRLGDEADVRQRAAQLDEFLDLLVRLWSAKPVDFEGEHYIARGVALEPPPVQQPRIPIWIGADHARRGPLRRAARWDGFAPASPGWPNDVITPAEYANALDYIRGERTADAPFDVAFITNADGSHPPPTRENVSEYAEAGVTWWLLQAHDMATARKHVAAGPPQV